MQLGMGFLESRADLPDGKPTPGEWGSGALGWRDVSPRHRKPAFQGASSAAQWPGCAGDAEMEPPRGMH